MTDERARIAEELVAAARDFYGRGWMLGTSGNLSAVVTRDPLRIAVTGSGFEKGRLTPAQIVILGEGPGASAEAPLHLMLVRRRGAGAVFHTHSVWATLASERFRSKGGLWLEGYEMLKGLEGIRTHEHREWIPILENSQDMNELAERMEEVLSSRSAPHGLLIRRHGLYTWGADVAQARRHLEILEFLLEVLGRGEQGL